MPTGSSLNLIQFGLKNIGLLLQAALLVIGGYYLVVSLFGLVRKKEPGADSFPIKNKFAILVAAHNEEKVISGIVRNLKQLKYPEDMYEVFVIADNCTDNTAKIARENGARVYERFDAVNKGKGFSLEWMFNKLFAMPEEYDAICILDADNLVSTNFLMEMNKQLSLGHKVVQGYLDSKNPHDTWISGNYSLSYWISNRLFQLSRHHLGLSCALGGTGFVMSTRVLKDIGWGATCLTEDLEFSLKLVLKGMRVAWAHDAIVYDEKPLQLKQSLKQRKRWMQGHFDCAERFLWDLVVKSVKDGDMTALDCALYLVQPVIIVLNAVIMFLSFTGILSIPGIISLPQGIPWWAVTIGGVVISYIYLTVVYIDKRLTLKTTAYYFFFPMYSLTWIPVIISGFIDRHKRVWVHTVHTREIDIKDIEKLEKAG